MAVTLSQQGSGQIEDTGEHCLCSCLSEQPSCFFGVLVHCSPINPLMVCFHIDPVSADLNDHCAKMIPINQGNLNVIASQNCLLGTFIFREVGAYFV